MPKQTNPIDQAVNSNLVLMEAYLHDMLACVEDANSDLLIRKNRNGAIGALLRSKDCFEGLKSVFETTLLIHQNAELINREED